MPSSYLTREGYEKITQELETLRTIKRSEVSKRLMDAMEGGEFLENAEYEDAKNEQAFVEGRIIDLELLLASAHIIGDGETELDTVSIGSKVSIRRENGQEETVTIVGSAEAKPAEKRISNESPVGRALLNHAVGDKVKVETPGGTVIIEIMKIG